MPKLSDTMTEGVVAEWHKKVGDTVASGDVLAEIETDKATMEFESFQDGVLLHIGIAKGKAAPVDSILAILGKKGENIDKLLKEEIAAKPAPIAAAAPAALAKASTSPAPVAALAAKAPAPKTFVPEVSGDGANGRLKASPLAKRLASEKGINITQVKGSGEHGRIVRRDIEKFTSMGVPGKFVGVERYSEVDISQMRKVIAQRLAESKFTAPHFYLTMDIDMDQAMVARKSINDVAPVKISFNDLIIKAVSTALQQHPKVNSSWLGDRIRYNEHIHIGVAVSVEDGLLVPVIRFADGKSLSQIATEVKTLAERARTKKLQPEEWAGNTFTISNLGMFGIEEFTAIINPPDACIMAIGGIRSEAVVKDGHVVPGNRMKVTLSCDHRVVDGALGSAFLQTFKHLMENPVVLLGSHSI